MSSFQINVPDEAITSLRKKLADTQFPPEVSFGDDKAYGAPLSDIKRLVSYWRDEFDWKTQESRINKLPQYTKDVPVNGFGEVNVHYVHQTSSRPDGIPLVFIHGWPGSFLEVEKILPLLTNPPADKPAFHVVAPSLPNFGFSQLITDPGFSLPQYAETINSLMISLGYSRYVCQGGDWGAHISRLLSHLYPSNLVAHHINYVPAREPPRAMSNPLLYLTNLVHSYLPESLSQIQPSHQARQKWFATEGYGYNLEQSTRPHTLGFGLSDSPVALLAWIYEKLYDWTDAYPWTDDEICTWVSIYWFSRAGPAASVRIYYETKHCRDMNPVRVGMGYSKSLLGFSIFPKDLMVPPPVWARTMGRVLFERVHTRGGHFAAWEEPDLLVGDVQEMFQGWTRFQSKL